MVARFDKGLRWVPPTREISPGVVRVQHTYAAATVADLAGVGRNICDAGQQAFVIENGSSWQFNAVHDEADITNTLIVPPDDQPTSPGHWVRTDALVHVKVPVSFETLDGAALIRCPSDVTAELSKIFWEITTDWTDGGPPPAIGVSTDIAPFSTKGALLGGMTGSRSAELTAAVKYSAEPAGGGGASVVVLEPNVTVRFDRVTSVFNTGAGFLHMFLRSI